MFLRTELGLGWIAQLGLRQPTHVRRRPAPGASPSSYMMRQCSWLISKKKKRLIKALPIKVLQVPVFHIILLFHVISSVR